jgi:hypothetical protein
LDKVESLSHKFVEEMAPKLGLQKERREGDHTVYQSEFDCPGPFRDVGPHAIHRYSVALQGQEKYTRIPQRQGATNGAGTAIQALPILG